ncbi:DUF3800 domain-containing protein [Patescibacteria group bacterium]|nr:DUF3800 domain-containing protein [Patescibacteria group bacterium]
MLVFIDESGDPGLKLADGASKFFTIALIAFEENDDALACDKRIGLLRTELDLPEGFEFHFKENSDRVREAFFRAVLPYNFFYYGIVINKAALYSEGFKYKESFYKYASNLLFENAKEKLSKPIVVIDESGRKLFKYQLATYLKKKINTKDKVCIKKVKMQDSKSNNLLQLADMVAGAVNRSLNKKKKDAKAFRDIIGAREIYVQVWPR